MDVYNWIVKRSKVFGCKIFFCDVNDLRVKLDVVHTLDIVSQYSAEQAGKSASDYKDIFWSGMLEHKQVGRDYRPGFIGHGKIKLTINKK